MISTSIQLNSIF